SGVTTVQTLSRLNRIHANKPTPMVVDFVNDPEMIVKDFQRYYAGASINTDIDPNALHTPGEELDTSAFYTPEEGEQDAPPQHAHPCGGRLRQRPGDDRQGLPALLRRSVHQRGHRPERVAHPR